MNRNTMANKLACRLAIAQPARLAERVVGWAVRFRSERIEYLLETETIEFLHTSN